VYVKDDILCARAYPNEMIVHFFCAVYPLSLYLASKNSQQTAAADSEADAHR
jgi:hypothetical protein